MTSVTERFRTVTFVAFPNAATHLRLDAFLRQQTMLWNAALEERVDCYRKTGKTISAFERLSGLRLLSHEYKSPE